MADVQVIVINGFPQSGKTTFAELCCKYVAPDGINISTVDYVKEVARFCGWTGTKSPEDRRFLSGLKAVLTDWGDIPLRKVTEITRKFEEEIKQRDGVIKRGVVFIHCREPHEILKLVMRLGAKTVLVLRPETDGLAQSNPSDRDVLNYNYDYVINNDGTLSDLEDKAVDFLKDIGISYLNII